MAIDKVKPLKLEDPASGGTETDEFPTSLDPSEDHIQVAGVVFEDATHSDEDVRIWRDGDDLKFKDTSTSEKTLTQLASGTGMTEEQHKVLRHLVHLADGGGPMEGFTSGAYREILPSADPFPTSVTWWTSSGKTIKIVEKLITLNANKTPSTIVWKAYNAAGSLLVTLTDTISYSGIFETSRTRTWA